MNMMVLPMLMTWLVMVNDDADGHAGDDQDDDHHDGDEYYQYEDDGR